MHTSMLKVNGYYLCFRPAVAVYGAGLQTSERVS